MGNGRSRFAGGDQSYLKEDQYRDGSRLAIRTELHVRYGTAEVPWFTWVRRQVAIQAGARVLDVGCGEARLWADGTVPGTRLTLVDLSAGMVATALGRVRKVGDPHVQATVADVQRLPFRARAFDVVVANHMLYHAPSPAAAVAELARVTDAGGLLVAATNGRRHLAELGEIRAEVFGTPPLDDTVLAFGIESGRPMLEDAFAEVGWLGYDDRLVCTDADDVLAYLRSVPPGEGADNDDLDRLAHAVRDRFEDGGGTMVITKESGLFLCRGPRR